MNLSPFLKQIIMLNQKSLLVHSYGPDQAANASLISIPINSLEHFLDSEFGEIRLWAVWVIRVLCEQNPKFYIPQLYEANLLARLKLTALLQNDSLFTQIVTGIENLGD